MGYTKTTTRISVPLHVSYTCSKCGKKNEQISMITEWAETMKQGTIHRKSTYEKMSDESHERAEYRIGRRLDKIVDEAKMLRYRKAELKCKCEHCNHVEPWSKMRFTPIEERLAPPAVIPVFIALFCFLCSQWVWGFVFLLGSAAIISSWELFKKIRYEQLERQIAELPRSALPTILLQIEGIEIVLNQETEESKQQEEKAKTAEQETKQTETTIAPEKAGAASTTDLKDTLFCRKCGTQLLPDSAFCNKCGTKVETL